jgi:hypothetical protein
MDNELARLRTEKEEKMSQVMESARQEARGLGQKLRFGPKAF